MLVPKSNKNRRKIDQKRDPIFERFLYRFLVDFSSIWDRFLDASWNQRRLKIDPKITHNFWTQLGANLKRFWSNLRATWSQLGPTWLQFGSNLGPTWLQSHGICGWCARDMRMMRRPTSTKNRSKNLSNSEIDFCMIFHRFWIDFCWFFNDFWLTWGWVFGFRWCSNRSNINPMQICADLHN